MTEECYIIAKFVKPHPEADFCGDTYVGREPCGATGVGELEHSEK